MRVKSRSRKPPAGGLRSALRPPPRRLLSSTTSRACRCSQWRERPSLFWTHASAEQLGWAEEVGEGLVRTRCRDTAGSALPGWSPALPMFTMDVRAMCLEPSRLARVLFSLWFCCFCFCAQSLPGRQMPPPLSGPQCILGVQRAAAAAAEEDGDDSNTFNPLWPPCNLRRI